MFSVVRFTTDAARVSDLLAIGEAMNAAEPDVYEGPRRAGDGFAIEIESSDRWADHAQAMLSFAELHAAAIRDAIARGARVTFDVAIDPEDQAAVDYALVVALPPPFVSTLAAAGIGLELTIYRPGLASDRADDSGGPVRRTV